jgi:two-component system, OmpR family, heavy metal sensor histidine kinase CusS
MTSVVVLLYATGSTYLLLDTLRTDLNENVEHELIEISTLIDRTDGSMAALQDVLTTMADVAGEPPSAFRIRDASGKVVAEAGHPLALAGHPGPVTDDDKSIGLKIVRGEVVADAKQVRPLGLSVEYLVDPVETQAALERYVRSALLVFLLSVPLAAVFGRLTARRGLAALRELVQQTRTIEQPGSSTRLSPEHAPEELRELAREVNAMLGRVSDGLATMRTFTASLAHELRSPLQNLIGETEVALLAVRSQDDYATLLRSNLDDLHDLSDAVDNLVAYCRSTEPQPRPAPRERFDLRVEAELRLQRERRSAHRSGIELVLLGSGDTTLLADREGVLRALRNLVGNALASSSSGTSVDVGIHGQPELVRLTVEDRGAGIPADQAERIFEPFVSGRPRGGVRGGYGLGLAICRNIVREHSGRLWHEPRDGGGTRFVAEFPRVA